MPNYIILLNLTDQGIRNIKDSPNRAKAVKAAIEKADGKLIGNYYTFGLYDGILIAEFPNDEMAMFFMLTLGSQGNVRTTTLKAFTNDEASKIIEQLP